MSTPVKIVGGTPAPGTSGVPGIEQLTDASFGASRESLRPADYAFQGRVLGHYRVGAPTGLFTAPLSAAAAVFSFRWTDSSSFAVLERITVGYDMTTAFAAAQVVDLDCIIQRGFTSSDTGGTVLLPSSANAGTNRVRASMSQSTIGDLRISATTALGAGTKTADSNPFGAAPMINTNTSGSGQANIDLYKLDTFGQHPIVFTTNEGFNVRNVTAWAGVASVGKYFVTVDWAEVEGY